MIKILSPYIFFTLLVVILTKSQYKVTGQLKNLTSISLTLQYTGTDEYYLKPSSPIIKKLHFVFHALTYNDFYFKITDATKHRFEVPQHTPFPIDPLQNFSFPIAAADVVLEFTADPFDFKLLRRQDNATLFDSEPTELIYSQHYIQIGTQVDTNHIYGLGERFNSGLRVQDGKWTIFNRDRGQVLDKGQGKQTYGYYPFYLIRQRNHLFHVNYLRSSNAMDIIKETKEGKHVMTYKVIGGVIDFRFFLGQNNPELALEKFQFYAGAGQIPPFWGFGYHQCRWGYKDITHLQDVISNFEKNGIPLDTIWSDIDYMVDYQDFTIDESRFPLDKMKEILKDYKYIPIIDAGIKTSGSAYEEGLKRDVYIKEAGGKNNFVGEVWPGKTTFVDFFHPNASIYWQEMLGKLHDKVPFSGVWLDMNELANFCDGACEAPTEPSKFDYSKDLPYSPGEDTIESHTISLNSTHYGGLEQSNVHVYAGFLETVATNQFLKSKKVKPFIISRSSTIGSSKYGYHWTGDNFASWQFLKGSISDNINAGFWGMHMVGPDICGFGGNTTEELCARWYQIGALYMFARNHNAIDSIDQEPYVLGDKVLQSAKVNLKLRYSLLKHFYGIVLNKRGLGTIWKPIFFEFVYEVPAYADEITDTQFLIGNNMMAAPIVEQGATSRKVYFPVLGWYDYHSGHFYKNTTQTITNQQTDLVPLFMKEGSALFSQNVQNVTKTSQLNNHFTLVIATHYESTLSTATHKVYVAIGNTLSLTDYNDDAKVEECKARGCEYTVNVIFNVKDSGKSLELDFIFSGESGLNEKIYVDQVKIMYESHDTIVQKVGPYEIMGAQRIVVPINESKNLLSE